MKIAVIRGDGIGKEIVGEALKVLNAVSKKYKVNFNLNEVLLGGIAIDKTGGPIPQETIDVCKASDAVLLGAVGGPKWDNIPSNLRPEIGLLGIRKALGVFANLRPAILFPQLKEASNLKPEVLGNGLDIMIVRELIGGAYFGEKKRIDIPGGQKAWDTLSYSTPEIDRIARKAFEIAGKRGKKLTLVDKANVLESSRLWRETVTEIAKEYKDIDLQYMYVDNASMQLIRDPKQFDVIVTENTFGDILSDEASMLTGSLGMLPSASVGDGKVGIYEPIHGSAPDIAGQDKANPIATIMSAAMMLRYSFNMNEAADDIENAVSKVLDKGYRTPDIMREGKQLVGTVKMGDLIAESI
ncbi:3-isopropylmalate dehydrogenase [Clostridium tyrobutyricum]|uniref:3-isopropylmalate dehydrogenase n=1 Tax=Clostridium tyrobutyricum DIVETGP TaxID=1408889 RepID=W6N5X3_CLOTY|nr:3-isopropylmalate dehydrogenase [Clostridium tyrobutyricum]AND85944.1 3-isopropylmalate dehydrogenase [Clostridium tyrobutyricum]ANP70451.1 3-isopropylmalate dehydrogenase [Clostridium tyrobutyricum]MBR9647509.1 3-isopropylmalate dehydrogenase [Clostridium tyrobutyricum]MBV4425225.1 3-isopropylmalate dehydrogenase [Clostridium tyrobutyricum]MBV4428158.1 3-isopropylmalate dehydrogenase [Clostridium tyrobutyricum]